ncbi:MAG: ABC transporter permease [Patescibacteria group bacterium]|nr:ABC transporter permease [Patescibacteria group bacterium]
MFIAFRQAIKSLFANPVRTGLTTLGIVIGVATVILVLSAGAGFRSLINNQVEKSGSNLVEVQTKVPQATKARSAAGAAMSRASSPVAVTTLKNRDILDIKRVPNVIGAYGVVLTQKVASYRDTVKNALVYGAGAERFNIDKNTLKEGRFYTLEEDNAASQVVILGSQIADDLFGQEDPLGKLVKVGDLNFQVIGVYDSMGGFGGMEDQALFMPLVTTQKKLMGIDYMTVVVAQMSNSDLGEATALDIAATLRRNHGITNPDKDDFVVQTAASALDTFNTIFNGITILLIAIAAISLIVGGVGIMNIMYVVVTERTAEIGLKKALGAKNSDILNEFLIESILVTVLGGAVGILAGGFLGWVVALIARAGNLAWTFSVPLYAIALGFGVSAAIGISFGVLPARSASKLDPVEAMRYE